ncbi:MAG: HTTM domain-containing protein [Gemmataceae bacterium]
MSQPSTQPTIPVREFFTLDVRSLALFRVALATFILLDWIDRLPDLRVFYSDEGILPRALITGVQPVSAHMLGGSVWYQGALLAIAVVFSLLLLVGWRTPWVCLVNFFLLVSVHARNPVLMQGGDHLIRMLTFWGIFLPLGACWSVDAARSSVRPARPGVVSPGSVAYVLQICVLYWFAAAWKWLGPWREEGTAVYLALHVDHFPTRLGLLFREYPDLCWVMTHYTIWLETLGPVMLLLPFNVGLQRMVTIGAFILFHAGLALTMELGHFPFVCMLAWLPLLPTGFWNRLVPRLRSPEAARLTLVVDPERPRTARRLAYLRTFLFLDEVALNDATPEGGQLSRTRQHGGWSLLEGGQERHGGDALARLFGLSPVWYPLARWMPGRFGGWLTRRLSVPGGRKLDGTSPGWAPPGGLMANTLAIFCLAYVLAYNVFSFVGNKAQALPPEQRARLPLLPDQFGQFGSALGIDQGWGLFAPQPGRFVGWYVVAGQQQDGQEVDALHGGPLRWEKPDFLTLAYQNGRWRKFTMNLGATSTFPYLLPGFTRHYFEEWNRHHDGPQRLKSIEVWWMREVTVPPDETPPPPEKVLLGRYSPVRPVTKGTVVALGTLDDGKRIDLMRAGAPVEADNLDLGPGVPIISQAYPLLVGLADSEAAVQALPGFARHLLEDWNKSHEKGRVSKVEILRLTPRDDAPPERKLLAEASAR